MWLCVPRTWISKLCSTTTICLNRQNKKSVQHTQYIWASQSWQNRLNTRMMKRIIRELFLQNWYFFCLFDSQHKRNSIPWKKNVNVRENLSIFLAKSAISIQFAKMCIHSRLLFFFFYQSDLHLWLSVDTIFFVIFRLNLRVPFLLHDFEMMNSIWLQTQCKEKPNHKRNRNFKFTITVFFILSQNVSSPNCLSNWTRWTINIYMYVVNWPASIQLNRNAGKRLIDCMWMYT